MTDTSAQNSESYTIFLCGDVMTGRGIDQILKNPVAPEIHEGYMKSALGYVRLAEQATGQINKPVSDDYIWGDALRELHRLQPVKKVINLETSVTKSDDWMPKGINYRMSPKNIMCISSAAIDCCVLANNHILDYGQQGLFESLAALHSANLQTAGAGRNAAEAMRPSILPIDSNHRILVFSMGTASSGVPESWAATNEKPGVFFVSFSESSVKQVTDLVSRYKQPGDIIIASIHMGSNWGYQVPQEHRWFAHRLIDAAGVHVVHGHSSHHPRAIEIYKEQPIFYGCGDFLNDYEGIEGYEEYRQDLTMMYFPCLAASTGKLVSLSMTPMQIRHFKLNYPSRNDAKWLYQTMHREYRKFGCELEMDEKSEVVTYNLHWPTQSSA